MKNKISIVLGVTGSIAAFKAAHIASALSSDGFDVHVIMTQSALKLVGERTFFTLSRNQVVTELWDLPEWQPGHISLAEKASVLAVAPCTANFIAKLAHGIADDALSTYALSHSGKILLAPAMNSAMWNNSAVQANCRMLEDRGTLFIGPAKGKLACGTEGLGRMSDPEDIIAAIKKIVHE